MSKRKVGDWIPQTTLPECPVFRLQSTKMQNDDNRHQTTPETSHSSPLDFDRSDGDSGAAVC